MTMRTLTRRVREQEIQRQIRYNRVRRAVRTRMPALLPDYCRMLFGSVVGLGIGVWLLQRFAELDPRYVLPSIGFVYSAQAASYKMKLARDPDFKVPNCGCSGAVNDRTKAVLLSRQSTILRVPNGVFGLGLYTAVVLLVHQHHAPYAAALAIVGLLASAYLGHAMIVRIGGLCSTCVNIAAVNVLLVAHLVH